MSLKLMMDRAYDTAEVLASHNGRAGRVFPRDVLLGMRYQAAMQGRAFIAPTTHACGHCQWCNDVNSVFMLWDGWQPMDAEQRKAKQVVDLATLDWLKNVQNSA